jgi:hypothetical protein
MDIGTEILSPDDPTVLSPEVQRGLRKMRTDLDRFSPVEIDCLIRHGYAVARAKLVEQGQLPNPPEFSWNPVPSARDPRSGVADAIRQSRKRNWRLWSSSDWASWANLLAILALASAIVVPPYFRQRELTQRAGELVIDNERLTVIASDVLSEPSPVPPGVIDERSERIIRELKAEVQPLARALVRAAASEGIKIKVISGFRSIQEQEELYAQGRTKPGKIIIRTPRSVHNTGLSFDVGIFDGARYIPESPQYAVIGRLGKGLGLVWGGDWDIKDEPHFETPDAQIAFKALR